MDNRIITVQNVEISISKQDIDDYICISDIAKAKGNIQSGEYITRNIDIENEANIIFDNYTQTEESFTGDNILNCGLNSPFIQ